MLYGISMRPKYPGYWRRRALMTNDGKPSLLPLHFFHQQMAPKRWQLTLLNDPLGRHLQYTPNIASLDHLTENVRNVLGLIGQSPGRTQSATSNSSVQKSRGKYEGYLHSVLSHLHSSIAFQHRQCARWRPSGSHKAAWNAIQQSLHPTYHPLIIGPTERPSYQRGSMEGTTNSIPNIASLDHWTH